MIKTLINIKQTIMKKNLFIIAFSLLASASSFAQQTCATAQIITSNTFAFPAINGTEVPTLVCSTGGSGATAANWYKYTPTQDFAVTVTTDFVTNGNIDNRVQIYSGSCGALICVAGDDDSGTNALCVASFNATAGTDYFIVFDNRWSSSGFMFQLIEDTIIVPNDSIVSWSPVSTSSITGSSLGVVDMNGDFLDDIISVTSTNIQIHQQNSTGSFTPVNYTTSAAQFTPSWSLAIGDYNADGYNDLLYGGGSGVTFMESDGQGTGYTQVSGSQYVFSQRSNFVDINNDGHLDAFVCHDVDPNVYYLNDGNGTLTFNQGGLGDHPDGGNYGSIWVDYNNDRLPDLFIAKCRGGAGTAKINELHKNNGNGTFTNVSVQSNLADPIQTWSSAWNDFDNDGWMDVVVGISSSADGMHKFMHNNGDGTFSNITAGSGLETYMGMSTEYASYDFNNDGFADVFTPGTILYNNGNNTFTAHSIPMTAGAVGDLNNDGFLDVQNGTTTYFNNGNLNSWLTVTLQGTTSNLNGIGARVEIYGAWGKQIRDVRAGVGFRYMGTLNAHFGLGTATLIDSLRVLWPSGNTDVICNPNKNSVIHIIENSAPVATAIFNANTTNIDEFESVNFTDASTPCPTAWNWSVNPTIGWNFSNGTTATSQNPTITFDTPGTYEVSLVASNSNGNSINQSTETIVVNSSVGVATNNKGNISIHPNPVEDLVYIGLNQLKIKSIKIASVLGAQVDADLDKSSNTIAVAHLNPGTYFLSVTTDNDDVIITRFIKK
jgi:PKD repeat protein